MDRKEAENRISYLKAVLWENSRKYYVENAPEISDFQYDLLMKELESLEQAYPEFASPDSPTRKVGSDIEAGFRKFPHRYPMLSLGNTSLLNPCMGPTGTATPFSMATSKSLTNRRLLSNWLKYSCSVSPIAHFDFQ